MAGDLNLSNLKPAQPRKERKRVGRGMVICSNPRHKQRQG